MPGRGAPAAGGAAPGTGVGEARPRPSRTGSRRGVASTSSTRARSAAGSRPGAAARSAPAMIPARGRPLLPSRFAWISISARWKPVAAGEVGGILAFNFTARVRLWGRPRSRAGAGRSSAATPRVARDGRPCPVHLLGPVDVVEDDDRAAARSGRIASSAASGTPLGVVVVDEREVDRRRAAERGRQGVLDHPADELDAAREARARSRPGPAIASMSSTSKLVEPSRVVQLERGRLVGGREPEPGAELEAGARRELAHEPDQEPSPDRRQAHPGPHGASGGDPRPVGEPVRRLRQLAGRLDRAPGTLLGRDRAQRGVAERRRDRARRAVAAPAQRRQRGRHRASVRDVPDGRVGREAASERAHRRPRRAAEHRQPRAGRPRREVETRSWPPISAMRLPHLRPVDVVEDDVRPRASPGRSVGSARASPPPGARHR